MRWADPLSPRAAVGREPRGGRSAHPGVMPSFWCPSQSQTLSSSLGLETSFMASEWHPAGTRAPEAVPSRSLSQEGQVWCHPGYLLTRTARQGEDAPLSMACHLVPSGHVCASPRLRASPSSAGGAGSSLLGQGGSPGPARGWEDKMSPGTWRKWDGAAGAEVPQQLAVISTAGSAGMTHVQPYPMGSGKR